jgi:hypothetical protein
MHFRFFSALWASHSARGGDNMESLASKETSAPSPSWFSQASGASELAGWLQHWWVLPREEEGVKPKIGGPTKNAKCSVSIIHS